MTWGWTNIFLKYMLRTVIIEEKNDDLLHFKQSIYQYSIFLTQSYTESDFYYEFVCLQI